MDAPSNEQKAEMQYDALIRKAMKNERKNFARDTARRQANHTLFSELDEGQLESFEDYGAAEAVDLALSEFTVRSYTVAVHDALIYDALSRINCEAREIVLMSHWLDMSDREIADETGISRRTVNSIRNRAYRRLREILEADGYDARTFFPKH